GSQDGAANGAAAAGAGPPTTKNQLYRPRYIDRTDQVRRMPVGVVLVVDQQYVQDVLVAFSNSKLAFQEAQWHWNRIHGPVALGRWSGRGRGQVRGPRPAPGRPAPPTRATATSRAGPGRSGRPPRRRRPPAAADGRASP